MRIRKIDDNLLLELFKSGKLQKEIAVYFGCSPVAVSKRLKRLLPPAESVLDKYDLTPQQKHFVMEKARGVTATEAAMRSYEVTSRESAKVIGSQLMAQSEIRSSIQELMEHHGLSRNYKVKKLRSFVDHPDPNIGLRGLDMAFKLSDDYPAQKNVNLNVQATFTRFDISVLDDNFEEPDTREDNPIDLDEE